MRPPKKAGTSGVYLMIVGVAYRTACDKDNIPAWLNRILPKPYSLSQLPFEPIAHNSIPYAAADRKTESTIRQLIRQ
jgi:hypothetical protein